MRNDSLEMVRILSLKDAKSVTIPFLGVVTIAGSFLLACLRFWVGLDTLISVASFVACGIPVLAEAVAFMMSVRVTEKRIFQILRIDLFAITLNTVNLLVSAVSGGLILFDIEEAVSIFLCLVIGVLNILGLIWTVEALWYYRRVFKRG